MQVTCPNCSTKYNLPETAFKPGAKAKCTVCKHVFALQVPSPPPPPPPPPPAEPEPDDLADQTDIDDLFADDDFGADFPGLDDGDEKDSVFDSPRSEAKDDYDIPDDLADASIDDLLDASDEEEKPKHSSRESSFSLDDDDSGKGLSFDLDTSPKKKKKKGVGCLTIILLLLVLSMVGAAGVYVFAPQLIPENIKQQIDGLIPAEIMEKITASASGGAEEAMKNTPPPADLKNIVLEDVRQQIEQNEKGDLVFVVEGKAVNRFSKTKEFIKIEAGLFDANGAAVMQKSLYAGNTVSLYQIQTLTEDAIDSSLNNKVGILTNNTNIQPGGEVPFMVVFFNPPETVHEFSVKVVEAKDPPKE